MRYFEKKTTLFSCTITILDHALYGKVKNNIDLGLELKNIKMESNELVDDYYILYKKEIIINKRVSIVSGLGHNFSGRLWIFSILILKSYAR